MTARRQALGVIALGWLLVVAGVTMLSIPLSLIVAGGGLITLGLLVVEVKS